MIKTIDKKAESDIRQEFTKAFDKLGVMVVVIFGEGIQLVTLAEIGVNAPFLPPGSARPA